MSQNKTSLAVKKTLDAPVEFRDISLRDAHIDDEARTVEVVFSTDAPVRMWYGTEVLMHGQDNVRLDRIIDAGPVLVNHFSDEHVGTVESVSVDGSKGRAVLRFGNSARATEIFNDIKDGIRKSVSVGYRVYESIVENADDDTVSTVYRVTDWEPLEISIVAMPADTGAKVGRENAPATNQFVIYEERTMPDKQKTTEPDKKKEPVIDVNLERENARQAERARVRELLVLGEKFDLADEAQRFIDDSKSVEDFNRLIIEKLSDESQRSEPITQLGLTQREVKRYSLFNAVRALARKDWKGAEFEYECSEALEDQIGRSARGLFVPWEIQRDWNTDSQRATPPMNTIDQADLVDTQYMGNQLIDTLRPRSVALRAGVVTMGGLVGNVEIPRKTINAAFGWLGEDDDQADTDIKTGMLTLTPRIIGGGVPITRSLLKQSSLDAENFVRMDIERGIALAIDIGILNGSGAANQPTGILNTTGVGTVTISSAGDPTWAEAVAFETDVAEANADVGTLYYITRPAVVGNMKVKSKDSGSGRYVMENNQVNGYDVLRTTQLPTNTILFGNFADTILAMWGVLDITVDRATKAKSGGIVLRAFQDADVGVRHGASYSKNA